VVVAVFAFGLSIFFVLLALPWFNAVADKKISLLWTEPWFWIAGAAFTGFTGILAGSYPALYLSSFNPVKALKGSSGADYVVALPRKVLVVVQFTVSITLIIGTLIVYRQIQYTKDRPVGYSQDGLLSFQMNSPDFYSKYDVLRNELKNTGAVYEMAQSGSPLTGISSSNRGFDWKGKDPGLEVTFHTLPVTLEYGKTIGWQFKTGRDFAKEFASDSAGFVVNEAAVKLMGLKNPVGEIIRWETDWRGNGNFKIIGVVQDMVMESPFEPVKPTIFFLDKGGMNWIFVKINPQVSASEALPKIETVFKKVIPAAPFDYKFVDEEYAAKFKAEERIGTLAGGFSGLAILISCLGLFGLVSYTAEQRTKEIGIRKVLGASLFNIVSLLSRDFLKLVLIANLLAWPLAYWGMHNWLQNYSFRISVSAWLFLLPGLLVLAIALFTVSFQAVKAAVASPVKSLRSE
jgi:ABC-type antimicrobial peptide transport system permease subunit